MGSGRWRGERREVREWRGEWKGKGERERVKGEKGKEN